MKAGCRSRTSPTQRTLEKLREEGWTAAVVERWNPHAMVRNDLFGFIDVLAFKGEEVLGIQTTSGSNVSSRVDKIMFNPIAHEWCASMCRRLEVWGWRKIGKRDERKTWECRVVPIVPKL